VLEVHRPGRGLFSLHTLCATLAMLQFFACQKGAYFDPALAGSFFPLRPGSTWTYRVVDEYQKTAEIFTDRAEGLEGAHSANSTGGLVSEYSGSDSKSDFTIRYAFKDGYVTRSFGTGQREQNFLQEAGFLPRLLKPNLTWSNSLNPFGDLIPGFHLTQTHHTFLEASVMVVPAGRFSNCIRIETEAVYTMENDKLIQKNDVRRLRYVDWYAPNVGLIKTVVLENGFFGKEIGRVELIAFGGSHNSDELQKAAVPYNPAH
jgi:hypothetical protein